MISVNELSSAHPLIGMLMGMGMRQNGGTWSFEWEAGDGEVEEKAKGNGLLLLM